MAYVATRTLKFGDGWIQPGEEVPEEEGRNYRSLLNLGHIQEVAKAPESAQRESAQRPAEPDPPAPDPDPASEPQTEADDAAQAPEAESETEPAAPEPPAAPDYSKLKQPELKALLDERKIAYKGGPVRNADLVALLEADDAAQA